MNEYIIKPMWFYWLSIVDNLMGVLIIFAICLALASIASLFVYMDCGDYAPYFAKRWYRFLIASIVLAVIFIFIPSKKTLIEMEIARHATQSNVEQIFSYIDEKADKIIDALSSDKEE